MGTKQTNRKQNQKRKQEKRKKNRRLLLICIEVFTMVVAVGLGIVFFQVDKRERLTKNLERAGISAKLLEGTNVSEAAQNHNAEGDSSRYGAQLADAAFGRENKIFAKDTISPDEVVLAFAGDVSFAEGYANMGSLAQRGNDIRACFDEGMLQVMENADIFMVNNEFPYTDRGTPTTNKTYTFRSKPENVKYLYDLGVDMVSIANNHIYDYGEVSLLDTLTTLQDAAMPYAGGGENLEDAIKPVYFIANDIKIAYVCATQIERLDNPDTVGATENSAGVFRCWNNDTVLDVIKEAKKNSDYVIAYIHWGTEMQETPDWAQLDQAQALAGAGADLIVGDHPHCLQQMTYVKNVPVIYSLGNFWFNSKTQDTGILQVTIDTEGTKNIQFIPALQSNCRTTLQTGTEKERALDYMRNLSPDVSIDEDGNVSPR